MAATKTSVSVGKAAVYADLVARKLRVGSRGKMLPVAEFFAAMPKGERRAVRKTLRAGGMAGLTV